MAVSFVRLQRKHPLSGVYVETPLIALSPLVLAVPNVGLGSEMRELMC